jgi:hypothetical protein
MSSLFIRAAAAASSAVLSLALLQGVALLARPADQGVELAQSVPPSARMALAARSDGRPADDSDARPAHAYARHCEPCSL